jgi:hypothetical protein
MSEVEKRIDDVGALAMSTVDALGVLIKQHEVFARIIAALLGDLATNDADLLARLERAVEENGEALTETQRAFLANFLCGGDQAANLPDLERGATAH